MNFFIFISRYNLSEITNLDWLHLRNRVFDCFCKVHVITKKYLSMKYKLDYFDGIAFSYSSFSQLKYVSLWPTCILSEKATFWKTGKPLSKKKGLSKLSDGNSAPPLLQQLCVCQADHFPVSQATCQTYCSPSHLLAEAMSFHFYSLVRAVLTLLKCMLILCKQEQ